MQTTENQIVNFLEFLRAKNVVHLIHEMHIKSAHENDQNRCTTRCTTKHFFISQKELKSRFLYNPKDDIARLVEAGRISIQTETTTQGRTITKYRCIEDGYYNLNLIKERKGEALDKTTGAMCEFLKRVTIDEPTTSIDMFMANKEFAHLFVSVSEFNGRFFTPFTGLPSTTREKILIDQEPTTSIDVVTMQPLLLGKILKNQLGENEFSQWMDAGEDIYEMIKKQAKLQTRDEAKTLFFEIIFAPPSNKLSELFGNSEWVQWVNVFKSINIPQNPKNTKQDGNYKRHNNLSWILGSTESTFMRKVWSQLVQEGIPFVSVHDEIIVKQSDYLRAHKIMSEAGAQFFTYFKIKDKYTPPPPPPQQPIVEPVPVPHFDIVKLLKQSEIEAKAMHHFYVKPKVTDFNKNSQQKEISIDFEKLTKTNNLPQKACKIDQCSTITDLQKYIETHRAIIEANPCKPFILPYINRMQNLLKNI
jgi:hypothetical protein